LPIIHLESRLEVYTQMLTRQATIWLQGFVKAIETAIQTFKNFRS